MYTVACCHIVFIYMITIKVYANDFNIKKILHMHLKVIMELLREIAVLKKYLPVSTLSAQLTQLTPSYKVHTCHLGIYFVLLQLITCYGSFLPQ